MSFYNTYRPAILAEIDNSQIQKTISSLLSKKKEQLPHAYLFAGPRGTGKTTTARIIARLYNCEKPLKSGEPCGTCSLCVAITKGNAMDIMEIDAASNTGVDNIRDLKDKILLAPVQAKWKIYIIDEVHMLSTGAFNALLKTLEEPPAHTIFVLATTDLHKVPATIQSRCLLLAFNKPSVEEIINALKRIIKKEHISIDDQSLQLLAIAADGSFRDATKLLEQASLLSTTITDTIVKQVLQQTAPQNIDNFVQAIIRKDAASGIVLIESFQKEGVDLRAFYQELLRNLQRQLIDLVMGKPTTTSLTVKECKKIVDTFHAYYIDLRATNFPELTLQLALLTACEETGNSLPIPQPSISPIKLVGEKQAETERKKDLKDVTNTETKKETSTAASNNLGTLTIELLQEHWNHVIGEVKKVNHATAGVLRSAKAKSIEGHTIILETAYAFHKDKLMEPVSKDAFVQAIKILFGEKVALEIVLTKK